MNKTFILKVLLIITVLCVPLSGILAQNKKGANDPGAGVENTGLKPENQDVGQGVQVQNEVQKQAQNQGEPQGQIQNKQEEKAQNGNNNNEQGSERKSRVANAVQEMLKVGERNGGIGSQIRTIAQNQNNIQEEAEEALERAQERSGFARFFVGPKYKELNSIEEKIREHIQNIEELKGLKVSLYTLQDQNIIEEQINIMEQTRRELEGEAEKNRRGFSLFGWLAKRFAK